MTSNKLPKKLQNTKIFATTFAICMSMLAGRIEPAQAEGSRNLYPSGILGNRASIEWRNVDVFGSSPNSLRRRTILQVYANAGEYILLGSTSVGVGSADIEVYSNKGGRIGDETLSDSVFKCSDQRLTTGNTTNGKISSRTEELAGPDTIPATITGAFRPCYYQAQSNRIYYIAFYGPAGPNSNSNTAAPGTIDIGTSFSDDATATNVAAWDVTVRTSLTSTADINGRVFADYLALFTGQNARPVNSSIYMTTKDGFLYRTDFRGFDPNGFVVYGNNIGYYDADLKPLYHNVLGGSDTSGRLPDLKGGTNFALPTHIISFNQPVDPLALSARSIDLTPTIPVVSNGAFIGSFSGNNSKQGTGGTFKFNSNVPGNYEIVISKDKIDFDAGNVNNRSLRGIMTTSGLQTIGWDGKDNSGIFFPVGTNYPVRIRTHSGEYHFPMIDIENNLGGGPSFTLLNATNPLGNTTGFYDDRGYRTSSGVNVGTPGTILCGLDAPSIANSDLTTGFNTTSSQRAFGNYSNPDNGNTNQDCTTSANPGSFGDLKGLDIWTYVPSNALLTDLNIISTDTNAKLILVKRITRINNQPFTDVIDGMSSVPNTDPNYVSATYEADDNNSNWPSGYLQGLINAGNTNPINPGDILEYTIYFLSNGSANANNVQFCDLVPSNVTFYPTAFNGLTPSDDGLATSDQGIALAIGPISPTFSPTFYLSNVADTDRGVYYPPNDPTTPAFCGSNTNGAIKVNITVNIPSVPLRHLPDLPYATGSGNPLKSYGFVRFRAVVK